MTVSVALTHPGYWQRQLRAALPFAAWAAYAVFFALHVVVRSYGDELLPWRSVEASDRFATGTNLPLWLQSQLYTGQTTWLERVTTGAHVLWFAAPIAVGLAITIRRRDQLVPYLIWVTAAWFVADIFFLAFPVRPPWMESSEVHRVLLSNGWLDYTGKDTNPVAAFPSLHACIPALIGLFLWSRWPEARWLAWVNFGFAVLVGFSVIYLGEHWLIDVVAGVVTAFVVHILLSRIMLFRSVPLELDAPGAADSRRNRASEAAA